LSFLFPLPAFRLPRLSASAHSPPSVNLHIVTAGWPSRATLPAQPHARQSANAPPTCLIALPAASKLCPGSDPSSSAFLFLAGFDLLCFGFGFGLAYKLSTVPTEPQRGLYPFLHLSPR
jgi:hypothetical protein